VKNKLLQELTWVDAQEAFQKSKLAVVPVGSIEQHGPHLPVGTDYIIGDYLGKRAGLELGAIVTPTIPVGFAEYHNDFAGTLSVNTETLTAYIQQICDHLVKHGVTHIIFVNAHGGNLTALNNVSYNLRNRGVPAATILWWDITGRINPKWSLIGHGDIVETSMMLAINPDAVNMERAKIPVSKKLTERIMIDTLHELRFENAVARVSLRTKDISDTGDMIEYGVSAAADYSVPPSAATAEMGQEIIAAVVRWMVDFGREFVKVKF